MNKNLIFVAVALFLITLTAKLNAQSPPTYKLELAQTIDVPSYMLPLTTIKIRVVLEKETVRTGPYARYAQKYLGVIAPLSDKITYRIESAEIGYVTPNREWQHGGATDIEGGVRNVSHVSNDDEFTKLLPDRTSLANRSTEEMARDAANTVFMLRKRRMELVTGETGENVYGEGLKYAIEEMLRMENQHLALFFGKQTVSNVVKTFDVVPEAGKVNYIAFRFSPTTGVLPSSDVSGAPIVLVLQPENKVQYGGKGKGRVEYYRVADWTNCTLSDGTEDIATARVPVYQFGATIPVSIQK